MDYKPPRTLASKIKSFAPTHTVEGDRRGYLDGGYDETYSGYKSVIIYIQKGLSDYSELIENVARLALQVQQEGGRKYPLIPVSFGQEDELTHEGKYFDLGYINDHLNDRKIAEALMRLSTNKPVNAAVIPELFPKTDKRSLYYGKTSVTDEDLLIIIGKKDQVYFDKQIERRLKKRIQKRILFVEIAEDRVNWIFRKYQPNFISFKFKNMSIKRYLSKSNFDRIKKDFEFLFQHVNESKGEYEIGIRDEYINIYYKGNSLSKIEPHKNGYKITINSKFFDGTNADNPKFYSHIEKKDNVTLEIEPSQLKSFFQKKHLKEFSSRIKKVKFSEELIFEQTLITDNLSNNNVIFIDRQVTDRELERRRLDLLALRNIESNKYKFLITEVKLGNNEELENDVANQIDHYVNHIENHFEDYKKCYEEHYKQKKEFGLLDNNAYENINIIKPVESLVIVSGYSGIAKEKIKTLKSNHPDLKIKTLFNELDNPPWN